MDSRRKVKESSYSPHFNTKSKKKVKLDTKDCCLYCLEATVTIPQDRTPTTSSSSRTTKSVNSFQILYRYLNENGGRAAASTSTSKEPEGMTEEEEEIHEVTLCNECRKITEEFSAFFLQLEIIRNQMNNCLGRVNQKISQTYNSSGGGTSPKNEDEVVMGIYPERMTSDSKFMAEFKSIDQLRRELKRKCEIFTQPSSKPETKNETQLNRKQSKPSPPPQLHAEINSDSGPLKEEIESGTSDDSLLFEEDDDDGPSENEELNEEEFIESVSVKAKSSPPTSEEEFEEEEDDDAALSPLTPPPAPPSNSPKWTGKASEEESEEVEEDYEIYAVLSPSPSPPPPVPASPSHPPKRTGEASSKETSRKAKVPMPFRIASPGKKLEKKHQCTQCIKKFMKPSELQHHVRAVHLNIAEFACDICEKKFKWKKSMTDHRQTHFEVEFVCKFCNRSLKRKKTFQEHEKYCKKRPNPETGSSTDDAGFRGYACDLCERKYFSREARQAHKDRDHFGRIFNCKFCNRFFEIGKSCKVHEAYHCAMRPNKEPPLKKENVKQEEEDDKDDIMDFLE